ncbi:MAG: DUF1624 domain-containing protein [Burkholderiales bacterium]
MHRHPRIDLLRGAAVLMMVAFHGCYDLTYFGYAHFRMLDNPAWMLWRSVIVGSFVFLAGVSLSLSRAGSQRSTTTRLLQLGGCALLVSGATAMLFGPRWIYFGVLHFFVVATLLTRPLLRHATFLGSAGLVIFVLGWMVGWDAMNPRWLNWVGLATQKPQTEDYAPLIPWLGLLWLGVWATQRHPALTGPTVISNPSSARRALQFLGRHSLTVYMVHQPLLFGLLFLTR